MVPPAGSSALQAAAGRELIADQCYGPIPDRAKNCPPSVVRMAGPGGRNGETSDIPRFHSGGFILPAETLHFAETLLSWLFAGTRRIIPAVLN